jgi:hypothetical protein
VAVDQPLLVIVIAEPVKYPFMLFTIGHCAS